MIYYASPWKFEEKISCNLKKKSISKLAMSKTQFCSICFEITLSFANFFLELEKTFCALAYWYTSF